MKTVLTIAGSDSIGGAGIQADIKTISANSCYAMSVITSVTAQNTIGVCGIHNIPAEFVKKQLEAVFEDIRPDAVKLGMLPDPDIINTVADILEREGVGNIVADTVMVSTSGHKLISNSAVKALTERIFPLVALATPNIPEAETMTGMDIRTVEDMKRAAEKISEMKCRSVLVKGGHLDDTSADVLYSDGGSTVFETVRIDNPNTHGTGCTLSSAIASNLALGYGMSECVKRAKDFVTGAIADGLDIGRGRGPLNHFYRFFGNRKGNANEL